MNNNINTEFIRGAAAEYLKQTQRQSSGYPTNRCSMLGDPCLRRLFYYRTQWDKLPSTPPSLLGIFATGTRIEPIAISTLNAIGETTNPAFRIVGTQTGIKDNLFSKYNISGTCDGFLQVKDDSAWTTQAVIDIKTANPNIFQNLNDIKSLEKYTWTRKYIPQLTLYALAYDLPRWAIIFVNKNNLFDFKIIEAELDYELAESLLNKAKAVNQAVETNTPPEKLNVKSECMNCPFNPICSPELSGGDTKIIDNDELYGLLNRRKELLPVAKEFEEVESAINEWLNNNTNKGDNLIIGEFAIEWQRIIINHKAKEAYTSEQWRKKIISPDERS